MILVSFFSEDNVLSEEIYIFEYQSNENVGFRFLGTPGIYNGLDEGRVNIAALVIGFSIYITLGK